MARFASGNKVVDKIFGVAIEFLNNKKYVRGIRKVTSLPDPDYKKPKVFLCGCVGDRRGNGQYIYISTDKRKNPIQNEIIKTLLHEVLHVIMPPLEENHILDLEAMLWNKFSSKQRLILKSYIPKRLSKKRPSKI